MTVLKNNKLFQKKKLFLFLLIGFLLSIWSQSNTVSLPNPYWDMTQVVSIESTGNSYNPSLAIDSHDNIHVVWQDGTDYLSSGADQDIFYKVGTSTNSIIQTVTSTETSTVTETATETETGPTITETTTSTETGPITTEQTRVTEYSNLTVFESVTGPTETVFGPTETITETQTSIDKSETPVPLIPVIFVVIMFSIFRSRKLIDQN